jgi:hypothetical protein
MRYEAQCPRPVTSEAVKTEEGKGNGPAESHLAIRERRAAPNLQTGGRGRRALSSFPCPGAANWSE